MDSDAEPWEAFCQRLQGLVKALPDRMTPSMSLSSLEGFGSFDRVALRRAMNLLLPNAPPGLVDSIDTLGELFQWGQTLGGAAGDTNANRASLATDRIRLRSVEQDDLPVLYAAAIDPQSGYRWRYRGATPSPTAFQETMYHGTLTQLMVEDRSGAAHGLVAAYNANIDLGHCYLGFYRVRSGVASQGEMTEGFCLFLDYIFRTWPFKKIYCELPEYSLGFVTGYDADIVKQEGCFVDHYYHDGAFHDLITIAIYRDPFLNLANRWWEAMTAPSKGEGEGMVGS